MCKLKYCVPHNNIMRHTHPLISNRWCFEKCCCHRPTAICRKVETSPRIAPELKGNVGGHCSPRKTTSLWWSPPFAIVTKGSLSIGQSSLSTPGWPLKLCLVGWHIGLHDISDHVSALDNATAVTSTSPLRWPALGSEPRTQLT